MFTGLVESIGQIKALENKEDGITYGIETPLTSSLQIGDSIAIDGCCLTVIKKEELTLFVHAVKETLKKTTLNQKELQDKVNMESVLTLNKGLGGHLVQGHIDAVGKLIEINDYYKIEVNSTITAYMVPKGSVAVDGISLTIVEVAKTFFTVAIIPHTKKMTTLGLKRVGSQVNIEVDVIGKYVKKFTQH